MERIRGKYPYCVMSVYRNEKDTNRFEIIVTNLNTSITFSVESEKHCEKLKEERAFD